MLGVWFFRLGLTPWLLVCWAPVGFDPVTFSGPFLTFLSFAQTLVPLALLALATAAGTATAWLMLWRPQL